ncbi:DUF2219 family protein [Variovorax sp. J22R133]|uniref:lipid A-modifier LpxR family protein n=1 Tax=Variovorax brevis TaxID=3053503 RepID=UPI002577BE2B|nr:lipid A-modifier LpxR family protein [Variovorax sp. J22R133]MDM0116657.1 DUF2219 family protein [Variovorax sp. J22R133]
MSQHAAVPGRSDTTKPASPIRAFRIAWTRVMLRSRRLLIASAVLGCAAAAPAFAEERFASVLFQNDLYFGHDGGGCTNGIFASIMRVTSPGGESSVEPSLLLKPIAGWLGLPQATLASSTLGQIMVTPRDLTVRKPDPTDAPYVGALMFRSAQVYVHGDMADMADMTAVNIGVIGPAAGAEQTQRFVHRVVGADRPEGWDSQVSSKALLGMERYRAWRFALSGSEAGKANGDLVALAGGALGNLCNLETSRPRDLARWHGDAALRVGLERSFPTVARVAAPSANPFVIGRGWFTCAGLSAHRIFNHVGIRDDPPPARLRSCANRDSPRWRASRTVGSIHRRASRCRARIRWSSRAMDSSRTDR